MSQGIIVKNNKLEKVFSSLNKSLTIYNSGKIDVAYPGHAAGTAGAMNILIPHKFGKETLYWLYAQDPNGKIVRLPDMGGMWFWTNLVVNSYSTKDGIQFSIGSIGYPPSSIGAAPAINFKLYFVITSLPKYIDQDTKKAVSKTY